MHKKCFFRRFLDSPDIKPVRNWPNHPYLRSQLFSKFQFPHWITFDDPVSFWKDLILHIKKTAPQLLKANNALTIPPNKVRLKARAVIRQTHNYVIRQARFDSVSYATLDMARICDLFVRLNHVETYDHDQQDEINSMVTLLLQNITNNLCKTRIIEVTAQYDDDEAESIGLPHLCAGSAEFDTTDLLSHLERYLKQTEQPIDPAVLHDWILETLQITSNPQENWTLS